MKPKETLEKVESDALVHLFIWTISIEINTKMSHLYALSVRRERRGCDRMWECTMSVHSYAKDSCSPSIPLSPSCFHSQRDPSDPHLRTLDNTQEVL